MATRIIKLRLDISDISICLGLVLYNFISKYPFIRTRDLSWDEPFSVFYSQYSVPQVITELFKGDNPPFYELFLHFYTSIFGLSETALRMPSLLFSCATVVFLYYAGLRLKGRAVGIFVALMFAFNNLQFFYSLAARMYAMFSMLVAASVYLCVVCFQEPGRKRNFILLACVNTMMCYTHYFAGFVIAAQGLAWIITWKYRDFFRNMFFVFLGNALLIVPMLMVFTMRATGYFERSFVPPTPEAWKHAIMALFNGTAIYNKAGIILLTGLILFVIVSIRRRHIELKNAYFFVLFFALIIFPIAYPWYYGNTYPLFKDRYHLYVTIPLFLLVAISISSFYRVIGSIIAPILFIYLLSHTYKFFVKLNTDYFLREWQAATLTAKQMQLKDTNSVVIIYPLWADLGFSYYYDRELYKTRNAYNRELEKRNVYRIWTRDSLNSIINLHQGKKVILYCDENAKPDSTNDGNYRLLQRRGYTVDTTYYFPQCTSVTLFHPGDTVSSK